MVYSRSLVTSVPQKNASDTYKAFGIKSPASMIIGEDNLLKYSPSEQDPKWSKFMNESRANKEKVKAKDSGTTATGNRQNDAETSTKTPENLPDVTNSSPTSVATSKSAEQLEASDQSETKENKKRGRPKGAKNQKTLEREAKLIAEGVMSPPKRKPGRPKGSRNKKKMTNS